MLRREIKLTHTNHQEIYDSLREIVDLRRKAVLKDGCVAEAARLKIVINDRWYLSVVSGIVMTDDDNDFENARHVEVAVIKDGRYNDETVFRMTYHHLAKAIETVQKKNLFTVNGLLATIAAYEKAQ